MNPSVRYTPRTMRPGKAIISFASLICILVLPACSPKWDIPTVFSFGGLTQGDAVIIENVFIDCDVPYRRVNDSPIEYEVTGIKNVKKFGRIKKELEKVAGKHRIDLPVRPVPSQITGLIHSLSRPERVRDETLSGELRAV